MVFYGVFFSATSKISPQKKKKKARGKTKDNERWKAALVKATDICQ
jgi:hypothetical protein